MLDYAALPDQRQALIRELLQEKGRVVCVELSAQPGVSEHTIRRDLHELSKDGVCKKVYGGAVATLPEVGNYADRTTTKTDEKSMIAQKCAQLIKANSCIFIDSGTTNLAMAIALPESVALTVVTNSPEIAAILLRKPLCEVIMLGGAVQRSSGGCVGSPALEQIKAIIFDQGFIGGCAMSLESGLTGFDYADCEFKKAVIRQCSEVIVGLTSDKIPAAARYVVASSSQIDVLVIEGGVSKKYAEVFQEADLQIYEI